ncbi:MAG: radical SAM protein [Candidatus Gygaella obscura]|nr:radical SAM protein [Candidatus Gygaella obscura]
MRKKQYINFSRDIHNLNSQSDSSSVCQFELTYSCDFHCRHCYSDCFNNSYFRKKELTTKQVKYILDQLVSNNILWVCFTGGDPLKRKDFLEIYTYAKKKGLLVTLFTNGYSLNREIINHLSASHPFAIEITFNSVTKSNFEKISQKKDSFQRTISGIESLLSNGLPLKIKSMITKDNFKEYNKIKTFIESLGLEFFPSFDLYARLNGDNSPCKLRLTQHQITDFFIKGKKRNGLSAKLIEENRSMNLCNSTLTRHNYLFRCVAGKGDSIQIDPSGNMIMCTCIRNIKIDLLKKDISFGRDVFKRLSERLFQTDSKCRNCKIKEFCIACPGKSLLEKGDMEQPINYYCNLARQFKKYSDT